MIKVLFVCMGNICRSPTAEAVFRQRVEAGGLTDRIHVDSAGTHDYHTGMPPDRRSQQHAAHRGYDLSALRARQVTREDLGAFDYVIAMDQHNLSLLEAMAGPGRKARVALLLAFATGSSAQEVPDPYYGGARGFETVLDLVEQGSDGLLAHLRTAHPELGPG